MTTDQKATIRHLIALARECRLDGDRYGCAIFLDMVMHVRWRYLGGATWFTSTSFKPGQSPAI